MRIYPKGRGTFESSIKGYETLKRAGCTVGISAVCGTHNANSITRTATFFRELKPASVGFNYGHRLLRKENPASINMVEYAEKLFQMYLILREDDILLENIERIASSMFTGKSRTCECQAQGRGFTVDSRGMVGICKSLVVANIMSRHIDSIDTTEPRLFQEWSWRIPTLMPACKGCPYIGLCGGGCTYDSYVLYEGDISKVDNDYCHFVKRLVELLKEEKYSTRPKEELQRSVGHE